MNKILFLLLLSLLLESSIENENIIPKKGMDIIKCIFGNKKYVEDLTSIIEMLFSSNDINIWFMEISKLYPISKDCLKIDLIELIQKLISK